MELERIFKENEKVDFKKLEKIINEEIKDDILKNEEDVNKQKWELLPSIYLENEDVRNKITEFIEYIDVLELTKFKKISLILTVIYLVEKVRFDIVNVNVNSLYLLVNVLENEDIKKISNRLNEVNDEDILYQVRCFSLDIKVREQLLNYLLKNDISKEDFMKMIFDKDYYEVLDIIK